MPREIKTSCIDIVKLFFAYCVVAIHTLPFSEFWNGTIYNLLFKNLFCLAVPYFFVCSGFFLGKKLNQTTQFNEQKIIIVKYFKRLAIPYIFWGSIYFVMQIAIDVINNNNSLLKSITYYLHYLIMSSPGGGLWYVQTILLMLLIIYFVGVGKRFEILTGILFVCYILSHIIYGLSEIPSGGYVASKIVMLYESIFVSRRNFILYGIFFVSGIHLPKLFNKHHLNKKPLIFLTVLALGLFICFNCIGGYISAIFSGIMILIISMVLFCLFYWIEFKSDKEKVYNLRKMSGIIYFTHILFVNVLKTVIVALNLEPNSLNTVIFIACSIGLSLYSIILIKIDKNRKIIEKVY